MPSNATSIAVFVSGRVSDAAGGNNRHNMSIMVGGTPYSTANMVSTATWQEFEGAWWTNPDGGNWDYAQVNGTATVTALQSSVSRGPT